MAIRVEKIDVQHDKYEIYFQADGNSEPFFKERIYKAEYSCNKNPLDLSGVPESVLIIPFLCNVLPIIWLENESLYVDSIDEDFYNSIENIQDGYCAAFGEKIFRGGTIHSQRIEKNAIDQTVRRCGLFYSGGVDSNYSLFSHQAEKPVLQLIWGNMDMHYEKAEGFQGLYQNAQNTADTYGLSLITIRSNYRSILNRVNLNAKYEDILRVRWWLGIQHLIALAGLSAPCNYAQNIATQYIAPTYSAETKIEHTRYPENVDCIRYFGCQVRQDAAIERQRKVKEIVDKHDRSGCHVELHVCFRAQNGKNCCICEKCTITILELMSEGANPADYGFEIDRNIIDACIERCSRKEYDLNVSPFREGMKASLEKNADKVRRLPYGQLVLDSFLHHDA